MSDQASTPVYDKSTPIETITQRVVGAVVGGKVVAKLIAKDDEPVTVEFFGTSPDPAVTKSSVSLSQEDLQAVAVIEGLLEQHPTIRTALEESSPFEWRLLAKVVDDFGIKSLVGVPALPWPAGNAEAPIDEDADTVLS